MKTYSACTLLRHRVTKLLNLSVYFVGLLFASALALANGDGELSVAGMEVAQQVASSDSRAPKPGSYLHESSGQYHVKPPQKIQPGQVKAKSAKSIETSPVQPAAEVPTAPLPEKEEVPLTHSTDTSLKSQAASQNLAIQFAAMSNYDAAESLRRNLSNRYRNLLGTLSVEIVNSTTSSGSLYRVRSGPVEKAKARTLCDRFKHEGQDCIVVPE